MANLHVPTAKCFQLKSCKRWGHYAPLVALPAHARHSLPRFHPAIPHIAQTPPLVWTLWMGFRNLRGAWACRPRINGRFV